jgi:molybdopterin-containing oxidoreductase family membrane subunit
VWTLPLSTYIFLSLTSAGLAFVASIPIVFNIKRFESIKKRTLFLEISVLIGSFVCLILHLGSPLHVIYLLLSPNLASPLWWLAVLYIIYLVVLITTFNSIRNSRSSKMQSLVIFFIAIATSTTLGWLLGMTDARPTLNASFFTMYFPFTAFASGLAAFLLFSLANAHFRKQTVSAETTQIYTDLAKILGIVSGLIFILFLWRSIIGGISSSDEGYLAFKHMIGSLPYNIELWLGLLIPSILMLAPSVRQTVWGKVTAAALLLFGMFIGRLEFVLSGVVRPLGQMAEGRPEFVSYFPTLSEILVAVFGFSIILLLYTLGERYLKLDAARE